MRLFPCWSIQNELTSTGTRHMSVLEGHLRTAEPWHDLERLRRSSASGMLSFMSDVTRIPCPSLSASEGHSLWFPRHDGRRRHGGLVPTHELAEPIPRRWRTCLHRLIRQVALHIHRETVGRFVPPRA